VAGVDARVARALEYIRSRVRAPVSLADAAAAATLSPSRFRHLFVQQTGTSFRAYLLWLRINVAVEAAMAGASWTEAAHEAGFADSSHLTRTHQRMFGIEPTAIRQE
jgi:AraC-like DNA-binding protein